MWKLVSCRAIVQIPIGPFPPPPVVVPLVQPLSTLCSYSKPKDMEWSPMITDPAPVTRNWSFSDLKKPLYGVPILLHILYTDWGASPFLNALPCCIWNKFS